MTILFEGAQAEQRLVVFVKTTFTLPAAGPMRRATADLPLTCDTISEGPDEQFPVGCTLAETDLWALKPWTDVVVRGHVRAPGGEPVRTMNAGVRVGHRQKWVRVFGDRRVVVREGRPSFTEPEPFDALELSWRRAYGGVDLGIAHAPVETMFDFFRVFTPERHPGAYPRNPAGRGWALAGGSAVDGLSLPNFETPSQLLTPDRLIVEDRRLWARAPIPAGFGWVGQGWFPRSTLLGIEAPEFVDDPRELPEVAAGWLAAELLGDPRPHPSFQSGASPGLRFAELGGGERITLEGFSLGGVVDTRLPDVAPEILVSFERRPLDVRLQLSTVELLPDVGLANLVWAAHASPPTRLPITLPRAGQRDYDLLAGVEVLVDGQLLPNELADLAGPASPERQ